MKVRAGIVGLGTIARSHLRALSTNDQVEIAAVCDIIESAAREKAEELQANAYTDYNEMLEKEDLDCLFVCVPPFAHGDIEEKAAAKGIHLFVEKPVGLDMDVVRKKAKAIREAGIISASGYCLRFLDILDKVKDYLADKEIALIRAHRFGGLVSVPWWKDMSKSGGDLVERTTHSLDMMRWLAGDVRKVYSNAALRLMKDVPGVTIPEVGTVSMVFESGALGQLDYGMVMPGGTSLEVQGLNFRVTMKGWDQIIIDERDPETGQVATTTYTNKTDYMKRQDDAFIQAIITGDRSLIRSTYDNGAATLEATLAANQSAETGEPVTLGAVSV